MTRWNTINVCFSRSKWRFDWRKMFGLKTVSDCRNTCRALHEIKSFPIFIFHMVQLCRDNESLFWCIPDTLSHLFFCCCSHQWCSDAVKRMMTRLPSSSNIWCDSAAYPSTVKELLKYPVWTKLFTFPFCPELGFLLHRRKRGCGNDVYKLSLGSSDLGVGPGITLDEEGKPLFSSL